MIFTGNFIISVNNTKEYLQLESTTKAQDTATSLGLSLKHYMKDKKDPEIVSIIKAIANRGFYKELRLEDTSFTFIQDELLVQNKTIELEKQWKVSNVRTDSIYGKIEKIHEDDDLMAELASLENEEFIANEQKSSNVYNFIPSDAYLKGGDIPINFSLEFEGKKKELSSIITMNKVLAQVKRNVKFDYIPQWFIDSFTLEMKEQKSEISDGWNTAAVIYVSANPGDAYAKLYEQAKTAVIYALVAFIISMSLLVFFLQFILKPLKNIEKLAKNISTGRIFKNF